MRTYLPIMITYTCKDVFGTFLCSLTIPYNKKDSLYGKYSRLAKKLKAGAAFKMDVKSIQVSFKKELNEIKDRAILKMASGIVLDMPSDITNDDMKIILAQFAVIQMQFK